MNGIKAKLKTAVALLSVVTGGLALINAIMSWIGSGTATSLQNDLDDLYNLAMSYGGSGASGGPGAGYILASIFVGLGAAALVTFGVLLLVKEDVFLKNWVFISLLGAAALSNVSFSSRLQDLLTIGVIGLSLWYLVAKDKVKAETAETTPALVPAEKPKPAAAKKAASKPAETDGEEGM